MARSKGLILPKESGSSVHAKRYAFLAQFAIVLALLGALLGVFLDRVSAYQELAEKMAMETTVINARTALRFRILELLLRHKESEIAGLVGSNPINLLEPGLSNYAGEFHSSQALAVPAGRWYYVRDRGELRYRPLRTRIFASASGSAAEVSFRVSAIGAPGKNQEAEARIIGANLTLLTPYQWF